MPDELSSTGMAVQSPITQPGAGTGFTGRVNPDEEITGGLITWIRTASDPQAGLDRECACLEGWFVVPFFRAGISIPGP
jgi:hypothetical protein